MTAPSDNTPVSVIGDAYLQAGLIQEGDTPNPEQLVIGMRRLTSLINIWQVTGLKLWLQTDTAITLVAGTGTYTLGPLGTVVMTKPLRGLQAYWLDPNDVKTPLILLSRDEWMRLSVITQQGALNSFFVDKQQSVLSISTYQVPDATAATGTLHVLLQQQVENFTGLTDTMNFPVEWRLALTWGLADELATGQPQVIMDRCATKAMLYKDVLEGWDVEDASTSFAPDSRGQYWNRSFR